MGENDVVPVHDFIAGMGAYPFGNLPALPSRKTVHCVCAVTRETAGDLLAGLAHDQYSIAGLVRTRRRNDARRK